MNKPNTECRFCERPGAHVLDNEAYCCAHFNEVVEHGGNIRVLTVRPGFVLDEEAKETVHRNRERIRKEKAAGFTSQRRGKGG